MLRTRLRLFVPRPRRPSARGWAKIVAWLAVAAFAAEAVRVTAGPNTHEVIAGKVYRTSQPGPDRLRKLIADEGIRTVINLRGFCPAPKDEWYRDEVRVAADAGVNQEDVTFSALRLPPPVELRRLIEVLDGTEYPILIHCKQGADRTGLAAAVVMLLYTDASLDRASRQLFPRYGHFRFGRTMAMDDFFDRYDAWLAGREHSPALFRAWATTHYTPGPASGTLVAKLPMPATTAADKWLAVPVTATNTSGENWEFRPGNHAGIQVVFTIGDSQGVEVYRGRAGLLRATVPPGRTISLTLCVPPLDTPGEYSLRADLTDATSAGVPIRASGFYQFGCDPLMLSFVAK